MRKIQHWVGTRPRFTILLLVLFWAKCMLAYTVDFSLGVDNPYDMVILVINPLATTLFLFSLSYFIPHPKVAYWVLFGLYVANTLLLYSNIIYYRQFTDFLTLSTILNASKVSAGLGGSTLKLMTLHDVLYWLDVIIILLLLIRKAIPMNPKRYPSINAWACLTGSVFLFLFNLTLADISRPQLLTRTFDRNYIVKYLGIDSFMVYDAAKSAQNNQIRSQADGSDLGNVLQYTRSHYAAPNPQYFGAAKGKNVIIIHLESFEQFLINYKVDGKEVTPFLNSLYRSSNTLAFDNFYHQVGLGRTSDAENMLENSVYGISDGSVFTSLGSDNVFQAAPAILQQSQGYTSAVFHGNAGSFWNRDSVYKNLGFQYFFDNKYFDTSADNSIGYGLKDKLLFAESTKYLEQLQQPFYAKYITVTNHFPFTLTNTDSTFPKGDTGDITVDNYFRTANYLDQAVKEFFDYLKRSGLYENTLVMIYGDHYGLSNTNNLSLAKMFGRDASHWTAFDNAEMQKVPFMLTMPGLKGGLQHQYGGEIDVLPTLLHLLGVNTKPYVQFGTDLMSPQHDQTVIFRNNNFVTPNYTFVGGKGADSTVYDNHTGLPLTDLTDAEKETFNKLQDTVDNTLSLSDSLNTKNLLRFYTPADFTPVDPKEFDYRALWNKLQTTRDDKGTRSTSLYSADGDQTTTGLYQTDAPELQGDTSALTTVPADQLKREKTIAATESSSSSSSSSNSGTGNQPSR
ncbi:LTA synthase family protein [Schleiferilactobacillus shenzhenensis]|nr:LTA synthase family protein [Schleiferilactobacillus shenzhenensis]